MKRVSVSRRKPPLSCLPPKCATSNIASQVIPVATAIAISEVSGQCHPGVRNGERNDSGNGPWAGGKENQRRERLL